MPPLVVPAASFNLPAALTPTVRVQLTNLDTTGLFF